MSRWSKIPNLYRPEWETDQEKREDRDRALRPIRDRLERHPVVDDRNWDEALWDDKDRQ